MRGPTLLLALCALMLAAPALHARRPDPGSIEADETAFRREQDRDERIMIRELVRGWTWATMPPVGADDDGSRPDDDSPRRRLVRVTAMATAPSGDAIVGGAVRGPLQLGTTSVGMTQGERGFIARIDRAGGFRMIRLAERETYMVPSALAVDRAGRIVVSYEDRKLSSVTMQGRELWSRDLPPARAIAFAPDGDILAAGCRIVEHREASPFAKVTYNVKEVSAGYVARVSLGGDVRWTYRLEQGQQDLFYRPNDRSVVDCATGIAPAPGGDVYVAGDFGRSIRSGQVDEPGLPRAGSFLARFSADGQLRWSRLVAPGLGRVALASVPDGGLVVVAGQVASLGGPEGPVSPGVAAFDPNGMPLWSLPIRRGPGPPTPDALVENVQIAAHRTGKPDFVCVGTYRATIAMGRASLSEARSGVFLAEIDRRGSVIGLRGVPGGRRPAGAGDDVVDLNLGAGTNGLWIAGTMRVLTHGAWVHAVPW
jgi:hypothetical protein